LLGTASAPVYRPFHVDQQEDQVPTFDDAAADAAEAQQALRGLAHATRTIDDPGQIYSALGSLSRAAASLEQTLHQLGAFHDGPARKHARLNGDERTGRAASHQVSFELHRAGEILRQVAAALDRAHEVEAQIAYDHRDFPLLPEPTRSTPSTGLSL
jgi:hypothetical protein